MNRETCVVHLLDRFCVVRIVDGCKNSVAKDVRSNLFVIGILEFGKMDGGLNMDDLISRKAAVEYLMTNMGWYDVDGYEVDDADKIRTCIEDLINGIPSVPAVPPEPLCEWLERNAAGRWNGLEYTAEGWKDELTRWMEEQNEAD